MLVWESLKKCFLMSSLLCSLDEYESKFRIMYAHDHDKFKFKHVQTSKNFQIKLTS